MKQVHLFSLITLMAWTLATSLLAADSSSPTATTFVATSPETLQAAVEQLDDEDFSTRNHAIEKIKEIIRDQALTLASVQNPSAQKELLPALAYNDGVIRWLQEVLTLPPEEQKAQLEMATMPGMLKTLSEIFSRYTPTRVAAIYTLAKSDPDKTDSLLGRLISDADRRTALAAMEVAWEKPPTPLVVEALWNKGVEEASTRPERLRAEALLAKKDPLTFRGEEVFGDVGDMAVQDTSTGDADVATSVLMHINATMVSKQVAIYLAKCASQMTAKRNSQAKAFYSYSKSMMNALQLAQYFKVREAAPALYAMATQKPTNAHSESNGKESFYITNRTAPAAVFLIVTDQSHESFIQMDFPYELLWHMWVVKDAKAETPAVKKIEEWWAEHGREFGST